LSSSSSGKKRESAEGRREWEEERVSRGKKRFRVSTFSQHAWCQVQLLLCCLVVRRPRQEEKEVAAYVSMPAAV
jgi:hypothetical protein